ncbi:MAG: hypothetical protein MJ172_06230 [Clostridia bacterium]|nr:hypothetical protein [Clostridia bacterium]
MSKYASLLSQLGNEICEVEDTEEMYLLRMSDDYQSKIDLGNKLASQYRFKEAVEAYSSSLKIKNDDYLTYVRLAGSFLTIRKFDDAFINYQKALKLLTNEKPVAFTMGAYYYLKGDYSLCRKWVLKSLPSEGELKIAVIYWHTLSSYRLNEAPTLLEDYDTNMDVGHHGAYKLAVELFTGNLKVDEVLSQIDNKKESLDYVIALYGVAVYLESQGEMDLSRKYKEELLKAQTFWPCISYLAAWGDING